MNDFHILSICIKNNDLVGAMRVLRDKSEFATRKILEKLKVKVTSLTGKSFWSHVQNWLFSVCRQESRKHEFTCSRNYSKTSDTRAAQSCGTGYGQATGTLLNADRSHQHRISDASPTDDVCAWPDGLPPVHAYRGLRANRTKTYGKLKMDV